MTINPLKWKHEIPVELIVAAVLGGMFAILTGYLLENGWLFSGALYCPRLFR